MTSSRFHPVLTLFITRILFKVPKSFLSVFLTLLDVSNLNFLRKLTHTNYQKVISWKKDYHELNPWDCARSQIWSRAFIAFMGGIAMFQKQNESLVEANQPIIHVDGHPWRYSHVSTLRNYWIFLGPLSHCNLSWTWLFRCLSLCF